MAYESPPIVEAVFDLQFAEAATEADLRRAVRDLGSDYPRAEELTKFEFTFGPGVDPEPQKSFDGMQALSDSGDVVIVLKPMELAVSNLAPYKGWDAFSARAWGIYQGVKDKIGRRRVSRIALRYVNRIDVPGDDVNFARYLKIAAPMVGIVEPHQFSGTLSGMFHEAKILVNYGNTPSPLVKHSSFLLDIDLSLDQDLPQRDDALRAQFERLRIGKNKVFEQTVTDEARRLFLGGRDV